jgi:hypothetical protein
LGIDRRLSKSIWVDSRQTRKRISEKDQQNEQGQSRSGQQVIQARRKREDTLTDGQQPEEPT